MSRANPTIIGAFVVGGVTLAVAAAITLGAIGASRDTLPFVVHLHGTVNGLRVGAPVKFKGIQIGLVENIGIRVVPQDRDAPVAVFCAIDEERLGAAIIGGREKRPVMHELVDAGLRARLGTESFVTGILYISLLFLPEEEGLRHGDVGDVAEIPSVSSTTERMESGVEQLLAKLQELDLDGLVEQTKAAVKSIGELGAAPEVHSTLANLDHTLATARRVADQLERDLTPAIGQLAKTVDSTSSVATELEAGIVEARATLATARAVLEKLDDEIGPLASSISTAAGDVGGAARDVSGTLGKLDGSMNPNSPLIVHLQASLAELAGAARAARVLLDQLERDPSQLLRGRAPPEGESK